MSEYHRETEYALSRIESALTDAQHALSCMSDQSDVEDDASCLASTLRDCHSDAEALLQTDVEDVEGAIRSLVSDLYEAVTQAENIYNRL